MTSSRLPWWAVLRRARQLKALAGASFPTLKTWCKSSCCKDKGWGLASPPSKGSREISFQPIVYTVFSFGYKLSEHQEGSIVLWLVRMPVCAFVNRENSYATRHQIRCPSSAPASEGNPCRLNLKAQLAVYPQHRCVDAASTSIEVDVPHGLGKCRSS